MENIIKKEYKDEIIIENRNILEDESMYEE